MFNLRKFATNFVRRYNGRKAGVALIVVSCTSGQGEKTAETIDLGSDPPVDTDDSSWSGVAYAATPLPPDAGPDASDDAGGTNMPLNPSHITIMFPRTAPQVVVALLGNSDADFVYHVKYTDSEVFVTLYLPQGSERYIEVTPADDEGSPLGEPAIFSVEPQAKLGTNAMEFGGTMSGFVFSSGAQRPLGEGAVELNGPVTEEYIDGEMRNVLHGIYEVQEDHDCRVGFEGTDMVYVFVDNDPVCQTGPFDISLKAGQNLGIYPVVPPGCEAATVSLQRK